MRNATIHSRHAKISNFFFNIVDYSIPPSHPTVFIHKQDYQATSILVSSSKTVQFYSWVQMRNATNSADIVYFIFGPMVYLVSIFGTTSRRRSYVPKAKLSRWEAGMGRFYSWDQNANCNKRLIEKQKPFTWVSIPRLLHSFGPR